MSSLTRWDPVREVTTLRDAMNQLFEQAVMRPGLGSWDAGLIGQMNVIEAEGRYYCQVALPGVNPDAIDLTVRQNTLTVKANMPEPLPEDLLKKSTYLLREFGSGEFSRSVTLPKDVNGDKVEAHYERGILTITVPLAQHAQSKRITIHESESAKPTQFVEERVGEPEPARIN